METLEVINDSCQLTDDIWMITTWKYKIPALEINKWVTHRLWRTGCIWETTKVAQLCFYARGCFMDMVLFLFFQKSLGFGLVLVKLITKAFEAKDSQNYKDHEKQRGHLNLPPKQEIWHSNSCAFQSQNITMF